MGAYEHHLEHVAEPADPSERDDANSATIEDFEALWLAEQLREFAHYGSHDHEEQGGIAVAYASFIDAKVREQGEHHVTLYAHTDVAAETLLDALYHALETSTDDEYPTMVHVGCENQLAGLLLAFVDTPEDNGN